jgi:hypothetical protein
MGMQVAETILQQLGGRKFQLMTGAKHFVGSEYSLSFKLPARFAKDGINHVVVCLLPSDTYRVDFFRTTGLKSKMVASNTGVYDDQLQSVFKSATGLDTHL